MLAPYFFLGPTVFSSLCKF